MDGEVGNKISGQKKEELLSDENGVEDVFRGQNPDLRIFLTKKTELLS